MEIQSKEKERATNIIWNASGDYSFQPELTAYDESGKADLYWNYVIGGVHRYYDYSELKGFFSYLRQDRDHEFYEELTWIGLENCTFRKGKNERPVLEHLRRSYARKVLSRAAEPSYYYLVDAIKTAHFQRAVGEEPVLVDSELNILNDLEFDETLDTEQIILRMKEIIEVNFPLTPARREKNLLNILLFSGDKRRPFDEIKIQHAGQNKSRRFHNPLLKLFNRRPAKFSGDVNFVDENKKKKKNSRYHNFIDHREVQQREYIQEFFGPSILPEPQITAIEQALCAGNHKHCQLHFTRGEYDEQAATRKDAAEFKAAALKQREKNRRYYAQNLARNNTSILKLSNKIKNTLLVNFESNFKRTEAGIFIAGKTWRNIHLHDGKVFLKDLKDDIGNLSVDILLDASGSQVDRQEIIASQAYIIAESIARCRIPVKVYSFCTFSAYTILNLFRDYDEAKQTDKIFNYRATRCNRDGLAIRTAVHMMKKSRCEHKILIVLSDGLPNDPRGIPTSGINPDQYYYADELGINDTAMEVRKARLEGISILCVYTGVDKDLPAAQKIYGHNLARIKSPEKFADIVGVMLQNVLKNL